MLYVGSDRYKVYVGSQAMYFPSPHIVGIEYIESSGTQYIDTGIYGTEKTEYEIEIYFISSNGSSAIISARGSTSASATGYYSLSTWVNNSGNLALNDRSYDSGWLTGTNITGSKHKISVENRAMYLDDVKVAESTSTKTFTMSTTYGLLRGRRVGAWDTDSRRPLSARIYSCKIWDNSVLVRDFTPVRLGVTGYLYDNVSDTLFGNDGTGSFIIGNDVNQ